jgi:predicted GIY-YIG superfamily endonuclease
MNADFRRLIESLDPALRQLVGMEPVRAGALPRNMPKAGIYLFSERRRHLYIGRTNRLRERINEHGRRSSTHNSAPFAFRLARKKTGKVRASYAVTGSRAQLEGEPKFKAEFSRQKARVRKMEVRFAEERDPLRQALLEIYASVVLKTPYNDFETH